MEENTKSNELANIIEWNSPIYLHYKKGWKWYSAFGIIVSAAIIWAVVNGQIIPAILFVLTAAVYLMHCQEDPPMIKIGISQLGIKVSNKFYPFSHIRAFWIHYLPPISTLHIRLANGSFKNEVEVYIMNQDPAILRKILLTQIPEVEGKNESFSSLMLRILRL